MQKKHCSIFKIVEMENFKKFSKISSFFTKTHFLCILGKYA